MEHAEDIDIASWLDQICDPIVADSKNADVAIGVLPVLLSHLGESREQLCLRENGPTSCASPRRDRRRDVLVDFAELATGFVGPVYFAHEKIRASISS